MAADSMAIPVPEDIMVQINTGPDSALRATGTNESVRLLGGPHQMHCVDIFRRTNYYDVPYYRHSFYIGNHTDEEVQWHIH